MTTETDTTTEPQDGETDASVTVVDPVAQVVLDPETGPAESTPCTSVDPTGVNTCNLGQHDGDNHQNCVDTINGPRCVYWP